MYYICVFDSTPAGSKQPSAPPRSSQPCLRLHQCNIFKQSMHQYLKRILTLNISFTCLCVSQKDNVTVCKEATWSRSSAKGLLSDWNVMKCMHNHDKEHLIESNKTLLQWVLPPLKGMMFTVLLNCMAFYFEAPPYFFFFFFVHSNRRILMMLE